MTAAAVSSLNRAPFESDGATVAAAASSKDIAPALSSSGALARFEFEAGHGIEGTKILMVEWNDEHDANDEGNDGRASSADWEVSWEGKKTMVSERDGADGKTHRLYFLLAPHAPVPPIVKISQLDIHGSQSGRILQANPLPAIFPPELGASARAAGTKGVLHTKWAKQRLGALEREIEKEMRENGESVGLEMAVEEKRWIEETFGVGGTSGSVVEFTDAPLPAGSEREQTSEILGSAGVNAEGRRNLSEKMKGLKLGLPHTSTQTLSPNKGDVAFSSFPQFRSSTPSPSSASSGLASQPFFSTSTSAQPPTSTPRSINPLSSTTTASSSTHQNRAMPSLDDIATSTAASSVDAGGAGPGDNSDSDSLFAVSPLPRSAEMAMSPFSMRTSEVVPWR